MRAYLIPVAMCEARGERFAIALLQRKDHLLGPDLCDRLLAVGGKVEAGESARAAALRELAEEVPGWWLATMGTEAPETDSLEPLFRDEEIEAFAVKTTAASARAFLRGTEEGVPAVLSSTAIAALPERCWVYPQLKAPLLAYLRAML